MTAVTVPAMRPASAHTSWHRIVTTARVHAANPWTIIYSPWLILLAVFGLNYAIWQAILIAADGKPLPDAAFTQNGGVSWVFVYMLVVAVQAMNQTFSFVVGLGATRRDYFVGSAATFAALSAMYGGGIALLALVERATDGWGVNGAFFAPWGLSEIPVWELAVIYTLALLFMFFAGSAVAAVFVRWGSTGLVMFFVVLALLIVAVVFALTTTESWTAIGTFFTTNSLLAVSLYSVPVTLACALVGWALMRRATPKG
ncbi:ABC transporter permease [Demequina sp.]|uniref:ABC transporter permease n=1 Tax=Demequina sp. TaxID=2050685 RepID=UPI003D0E3F97